MPQILRRYGGLQWPQKALSYGLNFKIFWGSMLQIPLDVNTVCYTHIKKCAICASHGQFKPIPCVPPPSSISGSAPLSVLYTSILLQLPQRMVFPILLASLQRTQLAMEPSVMSLTSQMNYVSFTAVQSSIIRGSICSISLQIKKVWAH